MIRESRLLDRLSHSGVLLQLISVRRRPSSVVFCDVRFTIEHLQLLENYMAIFSNLWGIRNINCKFHDSFSTWAPDKRLNLM